MRVGIDKTKSFGWSHFIRRRLSLFAFLVSFCLLFTACGKIANLKEFRFLSDAPAHSANYDWAAQSQVSNGANANDLRDNDGTGQCVSTGGIGLITGGVGCMQPAAIEYTSENQWILAFPQVNASNANLFGIFSSIESFSTFLFGTPAVIDPGNLGAARYVKFGKLSSGNLIAVYWIENAGATAREVYANIYNSQNGTWGTASRISTAGFYTDFGSDGLDTGFNYSVLCRPSIATAGDGTAMVSWCEEDSAATPDVRVKYRFYKGGNWVPAIGSSPSTLSTNTDLYFPGFQAESAALYRYDDGDGETTIDYFNYYDTVSNEGSMVSGDSISIQVDVGTGSATCSHTATVTAAEDYPGTTQFDISRDADGKLLECQTYQSMINALLQVPTTSTCTSTTLSKLGVSAKIDSSCSDSTPSSWKVTFNSNQSLKTVLRNAATATANDYIYINKLKLNGVIFDGNPTDALRSFENKVDATYTYDWLKSAGVSVAADDYGNYAMVRNVVSPFFKTSGIAYTDVGHARILVGHEYVQNTGWRTVSNTNVTTKLNTQRASKPAGCYGSSDYTACSSRNPKFLMSGSGHGIVFYHRYQDTPYTSSTFRNRLWYTTYSTTNGFTQNSFMVDEDTYCSAGSAANDVPVCETGSYSDVCQTLPESLNIQTGLAADYSDISATTISSDIPQIAADMNRDGKLVVAYHKKTNSGTLASPVCTYYGVYARIYDTVNGFGQVTQLDAGLGNTMHANVSMNSNGEAAVVWEEIRGTSVYVYFKKYVSGKWSSVKEIANYSTSNTDPMWPSVHFSEDKEIVVSYSVGKYTTKTSASRHQYVRRYEIY